jgi:hypothetical protein
MYQDYHFYVDLDWERYVNDADYLKKVQQSISIAYQYRAAVFYCLDQIKEFQDIDSNFVQSTGNKLQVILEKAKAKTSGEYFFEINFAHSQTSLLPKQSSIITAINPHPQLALVSPQNTKDKEILLHVKSNTEFQRFEFDILENPEMIRTWLNSKSHRVFNVSSKHGENGVGNWKGESVLLCNKTKAQQLLDSALPDFNQKSNRLFNFDVDTDTYIEFFSENALDQWHGFHITPNQWEQRVPKSIRRYFKK